MDPWKRWTAHDLLELEDQLELWDKDELDAYEAFGAFRTHLARTLASSGNWEERVQEALER